VGTAAVCTPITDLKPLADAPGLCPLCGTLPVASMVQARPPYASYRYLSCSLCACQWHYVRVQCSQCGAAGKDIAYRALADADGDTGQAVRESAVVGAGTPAGGGCNRLQAPN
jgi:FdhE protein